MLLQKHIERTEVPRESAGPTDTSRVANNMNCVHVSEKWSQGLPSARGTDERIKTICARFPFGMWLTVNHGGVASWQGHYFFFRRRCVGCVISVVGRLICVSGGGWKLISYCLELVVWINLIVFFGDDIIMWRSYLCDDRMRFDDVWLIIKFDVKM